jgi:uncharacterized protein
VSAAAAAAPRILRAAEQLARPWKNGGGLTRELFVHPVASGFDDFEWRVSIAEVRAAGPFSSFPGIERHMAILEGRLRLSLAGGAPLTLDAAGAPLDFPGETAVMAEPLGPSATDLNLMTRRGRCTGRLWRHASTPWLPLPADAATRVLVALGACRVRGGHGELALARLDALLLGPQSACELAAADGVYVAEVSPPA